MYLRSLIKNSCSNALKNQKGNLKNERKMKVEKQTLLASGYTLMYPIVITKGKIRYYFLGLIGEDLATTIMCKDADDYHYRVDALNESQFYKISNYTDDLELLTKAAKVRVNKEEFLLGVEIPVES